MKLTPSREDEPVKATDLSLKTENAPWFTSHRDPDSVATNHRCRLCCQSGLGPNSGPAPSFGVLGHCLNCVSSSLIFSIEFLIHGQVRSVKWQHQMYSSGSSLLVSNYPHALSLSTICGTARYRRRGLGIIVLEKVLDIRAW
jgi:hypothetical protein